MRGMTVAPVAISVVLLTAALPSCSRGRAGQGASAPLAAQRDSRALSSARTIAFTRRTAPEHSEIWAAAVDGSQETRLVGHPSGNFHPLWSPDGRKIAFASNRHGLPQIYLIDADGSGERRLTQSAASRRVPPHAECRHRPSDWLAPRWQKDPLHQKAERVHRRATGDMGD